MASPTCSKLSSVSPMTVKLVARSGRNSSDFPRPTVDIYRPLQSGLSAPSHNVPARPDVSTARSTFQPGRAEIHRDGLRSAVNIPRPPPGSTSSSPPRSLLSHKTAKGSLSLWSFDLHPCRQEQDSTVSSPVHRWRRGLPRRGSRSFSGPRSWSRCGGGSRIGRDRTTPGRASRPGSR